MNGMNWYFLDRYYFRLNIKLKNYICLIINRNNIGKNKKFYYNKLA